MPGITQKSTLTTELVKLEAEEEPDRLEDSGISLSVQGNFTQESSYTARFTSS